MTLHESQEDVLSHPFEELLSSKPLCNAVTQLKDTFMALRLCIGRKLFSYLFAEAEKKIRSRDVTKVRNKEAVALHCSK